MTIHGNWLYECYCSESNGTLLNVQMVITALMEMQYPEMDMQLTKFLNSLFTRNKNVIPQFLKLALKKKIMYFKKSVTVY